MQATVKILHPADDFSLLTLYEARMMITTMVVSAASITDDMLEMLVEWSSDEAAWLCNRVFAKETVRETVRDIRSSQSRLFVTHYPIESIDSITENGGLLVENTDYEVDYEEGMITRLGTRVWVEPVVMTYTGGYNLPNEAPPALKRAAMLMSREAYYSTMRGDASIKLIGHKESRVSYFDPLKLAGAAGASPTQKAANAILECFVRYVC